MCQQGGGLENVKPTKQKDKTVHDYRSYTEMSVDPRDQIDVGLDQ